MSDPYIVFTSVNPPSEAIKAWTALKPGRIIGVGDQKTPDDWRLKDCLFLYAEQQYSEFAQKLPWNHYCRKMLGYVVAIKLNASAIVDTDDDNIPEKTWSFPSFDGDYEIVSNEQEFFNIYQLFNENDLIWPRGFPLDKIHQDQSSDTTVQPVKVGIWQGLADKDPDVDAIYRLVVREPVFFKSRTPAVLPPGVVCPFNSQNTVFRKELFPLLYLPAVNFRFTDILRGLVAQPIMWQAGYSLGFIGANVTQERNVHDGMADFKSEVPVYLHAHEIHRIVNNVIKPQFSVTFNLILAYEALCRKNIVGTNELQILDSWLKAIL